MVRSVLRWLDSPWAFELLPGLNKLGRNPTNDFRISDPSISAFHAEIVVADNVIRVRDLGSTNGTYIDDLKVEEGLLKPENILRLGNVRFALDEVLVTPMCQVPPVPPENSEGPAQVELAPSCTYHSADRASYRCENCGGALCSICVVVIGQSKFGATTMCPMCKGQCYALPSPNAGQQKPGLLGRLTQTLRLPFSR
ncbi:MAG: FHA domain-containing protein [Limisphaerales bacterium]